MNCGILFSRNIDSPISLEMVENALQHASALSGIKLNVRYINADKIPDISSVNILINILGPYFPENGWKNISDFYKNGGLILNTLPYAFSVPYLIEKGRVIKLQKTDKAIHSLGGVIDCYIPTKSIDKTFYPVIFQPRYNFIQEMFENNKLPEIIETCSMDICTNENMDSTTKTENKMNLSQRYIHFERACSFVDKEGNIAATPIVRFDHAKKGTLVFVNFESKDKGYYSSGNYAEFLPKIISSVLSEKLVLSAEAEFARYYPDENPRINYAVEIFHRRDALERKNSYSLLVELFIDGDSKPVKNIIKNNIALNKGTVRGSVSFKGIKDGLYFVSVTLNSNNVPLINERAGFNKISDAAIMNKMRKFKKVNLDLAKSTDFCVRDNNIFAMHGTNYHTSKEYLNCFSKLNLFNCYNEMRQITADGFNIIRTGIWTNYKQVYFDKGGFKQNALRSMDAFFIAAADNNLPVQFIPCAFNFDIWQTKTSPFHNPSLIRRILKSFEQWAKRYKNYINLQLDIINEPSYGVHGWSNAEPFRDKYERKKWQQWLKRKYKNITEVRREWGLSESTLGSFEDINLPEESHFKRSHNRGNSYVNYCDINDFYMFARESFSKLVSLIRKKTHKHAPDMIFIMGRDENLRIPSQQDEVSCGNLDFVNWHHWHTDANIFHEYLTNKVKNVPCCAQEIGVYDFKDPRQQVRLSEETKSFILEKKILYGMGNWIQWQYNSNHTMDLISETKLGLYRADGTPKPFLNVAKLTAYIEEKMSRLCVNKNKDNTEILMVYPASLHFSIEKDLGETGALTSLAALHYSMKMQCDVVLDHLFYAGNKKQIGDPKLIILPACQLISTKTWETVLYYLKEEGKTVLISGTVNKGTNWQDFDRLKDAGIKTQTALVMPVENLTIETRDYSVGFLKIFWYANPGYVIDKAVLPDNSNTNEVKVYSVGKGTLIHCPLPVEIGDNLEAIVELYKYAMRKARVKDAGFKIHNTDDLAGVLIYPIEYADVKLYTIVNESNDKVIDFTDKELNVRITVHVKGGRGSKIYLGSDGSLRGAYIHGNLQVDRLQITPNGDMSIIRENDKWKFMLGKREKDCFVIDNKTYSAKDFNA